jgi:hypothetical protein
MKIRPMGTDFFQGMADGGLYRRIGGHIDITKLTVSFRNFVNAPKIKGKVFPVHAM